MRSSNILFGALFFVGVAIMAAYYVYTLNDQPSGPATAGDGPGPNLVITVAGEANGDIVIDLLPEVAPGHVEQVTTLADMGAYDNIVFHRVIDGFMAQTGDVEFGKAGGDLSGAGRGASDLPDLQAEFSDIPFDRGVVGMARSASPDSGNSQFFIMFDEGYFLNGEYTVFGRVVEGMEVVDALKKGSRANNGAIDGEPDRMVTVRVVD